MRRKFRKQPDDTFQKVCRGLQRMEMRYLPGDCRLGHLEEPKPSRQIPHGGRSGNFGRKERKMINPQIGEIVKYLRTGGLFQIKKVTKDIVVLNSQDGSTQIMTPTGSLYFVFKKIPPAESFWEDLNLKFKFPVPPGGLTR